jgi:putative ABC transport system permease protein
MNRELGKAKFRAIGSSALVFVAVAAFIGFSAMVPSALTSLENMVESQNISDFIVHISDGNQSDETLVSEIPGVEVVDHRISVNSHMRYIDNDGMEQTIPATLVGIETYRAPLVNTIVDRNGDDVSFGGPDTVLLEGGFAEAKGIEPDDTISLQTPSGYIGCSVVDRVFSPEHIMMPLNPQSVIPLPGTLAVVYIPIDTLREAYGFPGDYLNELLFLFDEVHDTDAVMSEITESLSGSTVTFTQQREELYGYSLIKEDLAQGESFTGIIAFLILLAAFFITYSFFSRMVDEERKHIGILRALGYSRRSVLAAYIYMAFIVGMAGSLIGIVLGVPLGSVISNLYVETVIHASSAQLVLRTDTLLMGLMFGPATTVLACAIAVLGTVSMEPHEAIKDMRTQRTARHWKERRARRSPWLNLSYITVYTLRNTFRHKRRTTFTVIAIAFSIVLGAMSFLMVESFSNSLRSSITDHEKWDLVVDYSYPLDPAVADSMSVPGMDEAVQISKLAVTAELGGVSNQVTLTGLPLDQTLHEYSVMEGTAATSWQDIMVGYGTYHDYSLEVGGWITLETTKGSVDVQISGMLSDMVGEFVVSMEVVGMLTDEPVFTGMYVLCEQGEVDSVLSALEAFPYVANVQEQDEVTSGLVELMQSYNTALLAFSMVGVTIATLTIANVVFMGVLERQREYGQLRAIGYTKRDTSKSIVTEILAMITIASIVAIPLLIMVMEGIVGMFREFYPTYSTELYLEDWYGFVLVVVLTTVFGLLAAVPGMRFLNRMNIAKTVAGGRFG